MKRSTILAAAASTWAASTAHASFSNAVLNLQPDHYYKLDETTPGVVTDFGTHPINGMHEGTPTVGADGVPLPGFDPANKALFCNELGGVNLGPGTNFAADTMTVAMWFQAPGGVQIGDRLFTNNVVRLQGGTQDSFQIVLCNGATAWSVAIATGNEDPPITNMQRGVPVDNAIQHINVQDNNWHFITAVRNGDDANKLNVIIDGVDYSSVLEDTSAGWGTTGSNAHIGVRADDGNSPHNHKGSIDDTAIWLNRALTVRDAQRLYFTAVQYPGDANADGKVGFEDLLILAQNYGKSPNEMFSDGDFNADGKVDFNDLLILAQNYGTGVTTGQAARFDPASDVLSSPAPVPEPATPAVLALAAVALRRARRGTGRTEVAPAS